jgi:hypothetical protein
MTKSKTRGLDTIQGSKANRLSMIRTITIPAKALRTVTNARSFYGATMG